MRRLLSIIAALGFVAVTNAGAQEAAAPLTTRVKRLENKTDFYEKRARTVVRKYRANGNRLTRGAAEAACTAPAVEFLVPVANVNPGVSNVWASAHVVWSGSLDSLAIGMRRKGTELQSFHPTCVEETELNSAGGGNVQLKLFCQFSVQPSSVLLLQIFATSSDGGGCQILAADSNVKMVNQEMIEPE